MASHHTPRRNLYNDDDDDDDENNADTPLNPNLNDPSNMHHLHHHHRILRLSNHNNHNNNNTKNSVNINNSNNDDEDKNTDPQNDVVADDDEDDDVDVDDDDVDEDSTSSTDPSALHQHHHHHHHHQQQQQQQPQPPVTPVAPVPISAVGQVTIALPIPDVTVAAASRGGGASTTVVVEEKKPFPIDESRKLFQRLWTDEDEIELLQGFLDYTAQRGVNGSSHHHDTTAFYDQIKSKLQLDFNKNQLVEKLRRLKKKYRNVMQKIGSGKEYVFKSPHDQTTFELSKKIWSGATVRNAAGSAAGGGGSAPVVVDDGGFDEDDPSPNPNPNFSSALIDYNPNPNGIDDRKNPIRPRKRSRGSIGVVGLNTPPFNQQPPVTVGIATPPPLATPAAATTATATAIPSVIEETVRSCLSPIFKELLQSMMNLNNNSGSRGLGGLALSPMPLGLGFGVGGIGAVDFSTDNRWRKQQILELEVFSRRLELVQDQVKAQLDELRGNGS